ncbi:hemopexin repeat-containing protein [Nonomuraea antimicrobica]
MESLRFNGVIDAHDAYVDKALPDDLGLMLEFYPIRRAVLEAMRGQIAAVRTELYTFTPDDFAPVAEQAIGRRVADRLDGGITEEGRVREAARALFDDPAGAVDLGPGFTAADGALVHQRIAAILAAGRPYRLDLDAVAELGFDGDERSQLVELLVQAGHLDVALGVPWDRLAYFGTVTNALDFTLPGAEDYSRDVFFLLHPVATAIMAAVDEVAGQLDELAVAQYEALPAVLQDAFGVAAPVIEAISAAVTPDASDVLVTPALAGDSSDITVDPHFLRTYRRIRRFARLAAKLGLDATEVAVAFHDQDLAGKFPEPLALPPGIDRFDALLTGGDGRIYLFKATDYWIYSAATHALTDPRPKPLSELSAHFTALAGVDAAFVRPDGVEWIVGRGVDGLSHAFTRDPGGSRWAPKDQVWGKVRNNFTDPKRIDNVFADGDGRTYVFSGDQYVRYSTDDYTHADEGYPRSIGEWWEGEGVTRRCPRRSASRSTRPSVGMTGAPTSSAATGGSTASPRRRSPSAGAGCATRSPPPSGSTRRTPTARAACCSPATRWCATPTAWRTRACGWPTVTRAGSSRGARTSPPSSRARSRRPSRTVRGRSTCSGTAGPSRSAVPARARSRRPWSAGG